MTGVQTCALPILFYENGFFDFFCFPVTIRGEIKEVEKIVVVKEIEIKEIEKPVFVKQIEVIEKPVVIHDVVIREVEKPIMVTEYKTVEVPIMVNRERSLFDKILLVSQVLLALGLVIKLIIK